MRRAEIYMVCLDPVFGREIGGFKARPVVIVSTDAINKQRMPVIVVPGTTTERSSPHIVRVERDANNGLEKTTFFQCHQVRAIDQGRMVSRAVGTLSEKDLSRIYETIKFSLGFP